MIAKTLALLARARERELDQERSALAMARAELAQVGTALAALEGTFGTELERAFFLPDGPRLAAAFAAGHRRRRALLQADRSRRAAEVERLEVAVREQAVGLQALKLATDALRTRAQEKAAMAEQHRLDEAAIVRHARRHLQAAKARE